MMLENTAKANGLGWALNVLHAGGREGIITDLATTVREIVGQLAAQKLEHASERTKIGISAGIIAATGLLNVLTAVSQHRNGRANWMTRSAQATNVGLLGGAAVIAAKTGGLGAAAPLLIKATTYTAARDTLNLFLRLNDNRAPEKQGPSKRAVATDMLLYGGNQIAVNELQGLGAAHSGTGAAALGESTKGAFGPMSAFSAGNGAGETLGALVYPALTAFYDNLGEGLGKALKGVQEMRLSTRVHVPFGKDAINKWAGHDLVGDVTMEDVKDKMTGPMLGRESLFVILYTLIDALSQVGPAHNMSEKNSAHLTNALSGLAIGFMLANFIGIASATPRRPVTATDLETGLSDDPSHVPLEPMAPAQPEHPRHSVDQP